MSNDPFFGESAKNDGDQVFDFVEGVRGHTVSGRRKCVRQVTDVECSINHDGYIRAKEVWPRGKALGW